jgi:hypothetical protein
MTTLDDAIARAAEFLRAQLRSGRYGLSSLSRDGSPNHSDGKGHIFVASAIAEAMAGFFDEIDRTIVLMRILSEEQEGLWGYNSPGPRHLEHMRIFHIDADDSAFALRTLRQLGVNRPPERLLQFYRPTEGQNTGMFVTYDAPGPTALTSEPSYANNLRAHPEVNFNVYLALAGTHFDHYIDWNVVLRAQHERGFWESYFYPSRLYATLLALELLWLHPGSETAIGRALSYVASDQRADGSWGSDGDPYETSLALACLSGHGAYTDPMRRGIQHLLATMSDDGSWASSACIWSAPTPPADHWSGFDPQRTYTTARCLIALRRAAPQLR